MENLITGQWHCGTVQWQAVLPHKMALNCHCNMCRSLSGADFSSWVVFAAANFKLTSGIEGLTTYQASDTFSKSFCTKCGSTVSCINDAKFPNHVFITKGNITSEFSLPAKIQVCTTDKANWVEIDENIAVFNP